MSHRALTLQERAAHVKGAVPPDRLNSSLLKRWQSQKPFQDTSVLDERLNAAGLSRSVFEAAISLDIPEDTNGTSTDADVVSTMAAARADHPDWQTVLAGIKPHKAEGVEAFSSLIGPLLVAAHRRVLTACTTLADRVPIVPEHVALSASSHLAGRVARMAQRVVLLELYKAKQNGLLSGNTSEHRFESFCDMLTQSSYADDLLTAYPVLARQLMLTVDRWETVTLEMLDRYADDFETLAKNFTDENSLGPLDSVTLEAGDHHRDGRTVCFLHFAGGKSVVYKPRSLAVDVALAHLLDWMRARGFRIALKIPHSLDRGTYGWAEFIDQAACRSDDEITSFYERQGAWLAVFYILCGNDFHHENLIAAGPHPVPVDLETLFQPDLTTVGLAGGFAAAGSEVYGTVMTVGLLPSRIWGRKGGKEGGIDMSGMGAAGEMSPVASLVLEEAGTDRMRLVRKPVAVPPARHLPTLNGEPVNVVEHTDAFTNGFAEAYDFILTHRAGLLGKDGPLDGFRDVEARVILRATYYYGLLMMDAFHPDVLRDGLERDLYLDRLWMNVPLRRLEPKIIEAERRDMWRNDIPGFYIRPGHTHIWTADGDRIADIWSQTPMDRVREKLETLGPGDRARQLWLVEKTLATLPLRHRLVGYDDYPVPRDLPVLASKDYLKEAEAVANRLAELGFTAADGSMIWMTCSPAGVGHWIYAEMENDLYGGLPGMCLLFGYLHAVTGKAHYGLLARQTWKTVEHILENPGYAVQNPGAFTGWGGLLYAARHLSAVLKDDSFLEGVIDRLPDPADLVANDRTYDLVGGAAGFLACALPLVGDGHSGLLDHCRACGEHLLAHARDMDTGIGWHLEVAGAEPLGGFSHGAAGIAWSLLLLSSHTGDTRFRDAAVRALDYDRSLYSPEEENWRDLREGARPGESVAADEHYLVAWCHGAPGVGLSRLLIRDLMDDDGCRDEIRIAVSKTLDDGFGRNHSLCHGDFGNLEFLGAVADADKDEELMAACRHLAAGIVDVGRRQGWHTGFPSGTEPLGLMTGLAGIGLALLKLAAPDKVPSVLALEMPPRQAVGKQEGMAV